MMNAFLTKAVTCSDQSHTLHLTFVTIIISILAYRCKQTAVLLTEFLEFFSMINLA